MRALAIIIFLLFTSCAMSHIERSYYPTGELCGEMLFEGGEVVSYREYYESGKPKLYIDYSDPLYTETKIYGADGSVQKETRENR